MSGGFDLVIVGCGPVGAYAANLFGRAGLKTLVLEREQSPYSLPRAIHVDHEVMRLLADVELLEPLADRLRAADGHLHIGADRGVIRQLTSAGAPRPFGYASDYFFFQPELEEALRTGLHRYPNVTLRLGVEVVGLEQRSNDVRLSLDDGGTVATRWVLGTDGGRSTVRSLLRIPLDDLRFEEPWLVVDAEVEGPIVFPDFSGVGAGTDLQKVSVMLCDPARPMTIVPGRGTHRRWEFMLLPGEEDARMAEPDVVRTLIAPWIGDAPHSIIRAATYRFHGLVATSWMKDRCFLAGDAAHQTPPFFGQGLCHGLRDAANLAWKLALVHSGQAGSSLLDTYQVEREPQVRQVIAKAIEAGRYICLLDPAQAAARDARVRRMKDIETAGDLIGPIASAIISTDGGERFINPLVNGGHVLLDSATGRGWRLLTRQDLTLTGDASEVLRVLGCKQLRLGRDLDDTEGYLEAWCDAKQVEAVIVRPDFYVAAAESDAHKLSAQIVRMGAAMDLSATGHLARTGRHILS